MSVAEQPETRYCDECGSDYLAASSPMVSLCPECSHQLYGYPPCPHEFVGGRCSRCGWDGSVSAYLRKFQSLHESPPDAEPGDSADGGE